MRNKLLKILIYCLSAVMLLTGFTTAIAAENNQAIGGANSFIDGIIGYKLKASGADNIQKWIDGELTTNAGISSEWYVIALSQSGNYDFSGYEKALLKYLSLNKVYSASSRQKYALALAASGSTDEYIYTTLNDSIGQQGIMSYVFGLHLLNNGYSSEDYSVASLKDKILSMQLSDGGWAITGANSDVDVTAMTIQALAPYYNSDSMVKAAVDKALKFLSERQKASGAYASHGVENPESTAQVLVALSSLGIDSVSDSRFIKNGCTLFDGIEQYLLADKTFCHTLNGGYNETATVQVFYAMVSYNRMKDGKTPLYILDKANVKEIKAPDANEAATNETASTTKSVKATEDSTTTIKSTEEVKVREEHTSTAKITENDRETTTAKNIEATNEIVNETVSETNSESGQTTEAIAEEKNTTIKSAIKSVLKNSVEVESTDYSTENAIEDKHSENKANGSGYKIWINLFIIAIAGCISIVLYIKRSRKKRDYIIILIIAIIAIIFASVTDFKTPAEYYKTVDETKENVIGTVSLSIRCDTILDKAEGDNIPENGIILDLFQCEIEEGDTVYDVLMDATAKYKIQIETTGSGDGIYVEGINYIYEFDYGDLSGWMYFVDGTKPSVGCGKYELTGGEVIEWKYTCKLGNDID